MVLLLACAAAVALGEEKPRLVVFVCEHGSVKSLIASEWLGRLAAERGVRVRGISRGITPDAAVPAPIAEHLHGDGFDVGRFQPRQLQPADIEGASRVVAIGAELPAWVSGSGLPVERWDEVPPASENYEASRDALRRHIRALLETLAARP